MKRIVKFGVMLIVALSLVACGNENVEVLEENNTVEENVVVEEAVAEAGVLKVGMEIGYPPFEYFDNDGTTPIGVDVELAYEIGERIGMEIELVDTGWDGIFAGINKGDYDCVISAVTITSDRLLDFDFSTPYIQNYQCIVSVEGSAIQPASPSELAGLKVAYQEETTSDAFVTEFAADNGLDIEVFEYAKVMNCYDDLANGRVDAIVCDSTVATSYVGEGTGYVQTWIQDTDAEEFGVCIKKGNTELVEKINAALEEMKNDGTLEAILASYF